MMKKITKIDVQPMCDEIDNDLWEPTGDMVGHGRNWIGSEIQTLIRHKTLFDCRRPEYGPCDFETPLDDLCLPDYCPTNTLFMYPEAIDTLVWFATTYGGKYARAMYYRTQPGTNVGVHLDAQPDSFNVGVMNNGVLSGKNGFYYKKDRYHVVIDGSYEYTVDHELEDKLYELPLNKTFQKWPGEFMTLPVTKTFSKGEVWWFNNKRPHTSYNNGDIPKINLVFDIDRSGAERIDHDYP
tara:strand:+ start:649 stop:1365 length:717 start_codon:yes stop_codon:yes gene_type:complete